MPESLNEQEIRRQEWTVPPPIVGQTSVTLQAVPWSRVALNLEACWKISRGTGCKIGIVDTGIDADHEALAGRIGDAKDFTDSRYGPGDFQSHGSHCAGTMVGKSVGIAPDGMVWSAKGLGDNGSGSSQQIVRALDWLGAQGVHVINMSLGSPYPDPYIRRAIETLEAAGIPVICAMGNSGPGQNTGEYPGMWPVVTGVAAVDRELKIAEFSSRSHEVDIAAPGVNILSARAGGGYVEYSGTSMATPATVGCYALAWAAGVGGRLSASIRRKMYESAHDIDVKGRDSNAGHGFVNPLGMLQGVLPPPVIPPPGPVPIPIPPPVPPPGGPRPIDTIFDWIMGVITDPVVRAVLVLIKKLVDMYLDMSGAEAVQARPILRRLINRELDQLIAQATDPAIKATLELAKTLINQYLDTLQAVRV